jgi:hypothetical protein
MRTSLAVVFSLGGLAFAACSAGKGTGGAAGASASGAAGGGGRATGGASSVGTAGGQGSAGAPGGGAGASGAGGGQSAGAGGGSGPGTGGAAQGTGGIGPVDTAQSVLERNKHPSRDGNFVQPLLTKAMAAKMSPDPGFAGVYQGAMWNVPLYMENGPANKGAFFVATMNNDVVAFDEAAGATVWTKNLAPVAQGAPCGGPYSSVGIFGTPVIDAASRTLFVVVPVGPQGITAFVVHALSVDDGQERSGWPIDVSTVIPGFAPAKHNQRGALSLVNGILYIPFGGHWGDCNPYQGRVLAIDIKDPTKTGNWATSGERAAIWAAGGMASDGDGVFAVTGDGARAGGGTHQPTGDKDSEAVIRVTGMALVDRSDANYYYPARWETMDRLDSDFGSNSPVFIQIPGSPQAGYVVAAAKDGHMYFLDSKHLGGMDGHLFDLDVSNGAMSLHTALSSYATAAGVYVVLSTDQGASCPGGDGGKAIISVSVPVVAGKLKPTVAWCATQSSTVVSPIATTTDGKSDAIVWYMNGANLVGVDGDTGLPIVTTAGACPGVMRWTSPIAAKGRLLVGGNGKLCSWSPK